MQTILDNYINANLTELAFSFLNKVVCPLSLFMHEEILNWYLTCPSVTWWLTCCSRNPHHMQSLKSYSSMKLHTNAAFVPNHRSVFLHVTNVSNRDQEGPWRKQKIRQSHQQCDYSWRKLLFIRCKASCSYRTPKSPWKTSGLQLAAWTVLCHLSYKNSITLK